jgi:hypothetical protein
MPDMPAQDRRWLAVGHSSLTDARAAGSAATDNAMQSDHDYQTLVVLAVG